MRKIVTQMAVAAGIAAFAAPAMGAVTVNFYPGGTGAPTGDNDIANFDTTFGSGPTGTPGSDYVIQTGDNALGAEPNVGDQGDAYLSVLGGGTTSFTFDPYTGQLIFDYGSLDSYNTITISFLNSGDEVFTGTDIINTPPANGDQTADRTNGIVVFTAMPGDYITGLTLASSVNSLEIDNIRTNTVPEPGTWLMMLLGFGTMGLALRRRRSGQFALRQLV